ncbi:YciI family protein [Streptomyces sp. NPDC088387]|uniref:YciI family protein n=1 Tax=Streptomyces sp. NPDC088387 TaxID=3365859 RepID=UPI0038001B32
MLFYVHAPDRPGTGTALLELAEDHWSYMDRFADRLVLRGPTLSEDGEEHTGSVHVVDVPDRAAAERFAHEEPFWRAGLYRHLTVARTAVLHHQDLLGDADPSDVVTALVTGEWAPRPHDPAREAPAGEPDVRAGFVAVLLDDGGTRTTGIVATVRAAPADAPDAVRALADRLAGGPVALAARRWMRGGRS